MEDSYLAAGVFPAGVPWTTGSSPLACDTHFLICGVLTRRSWAIPPQTRWKPRTSWVDGTWKDRATDCSTSVAFYPELVIVMALSDLEDLGLTGPGRTGRQKLHLLSLGPRTCGCHSSLGLGRLVAQTLGRKLKDLFWSMCWVVNIMCWVSKCLLVRHHHVLGQPCLLGRPRSQARHLLPSRAPLLTRHLPRWPVILHWVGNLSRASLPSRHPAGPGRDGPVTLWRRPVPWSRAVESGVLHPSKIGHMVPPSCFVDRQRMNLHTSQNKRCFMSNVTWKKAHSCDRLTSKVNSHQLTSFLASKNAWERPLGQCMSDSHPNTSEAKIEVKDGRMWCSAQVRLHMDRQGDSISLCEISPGIGWRADYMQPLLRRS